MSAVPKRGFIMYVGQRGPSLFEAIEYLCVKWGVCNLRLVKSTEGQLGWKVGSIIFPKGKEDNGGWAECTHAHWKRPERIVPGRMMQLAFPELDEFPKRAKDLIRSALFNLFDTEVLQACLRFHGKSVRQKNRAYALNKLVRCKGGRAYFQWMKREAYTRRRWDSRVHQWGNLLETARSKERKELFNRVGIKRIPCMFTECLPLWREMNEAQWHKFLVLLVEKKSGKNLFDTIRVRFVRPRALQQLKDIEIEIRLRRSKSKRPPKEESFYTSDGPSAWLKKRRPIYLTDKRY